MSYEHEYEFDYERIEEAKIPSKEELMEWCDAILAKLMGRWGSVQPTIIYNEEENEYYTGPSKYYNAFIVVEFNFHEGDLCDMFDIYPDTEISEADYLDSACDYIIEKLEESKLCSETLLKEIEKCLKEVIKNVYPDAKNTPLKL